MKTDIDALMEEEGIDVLLVTGASGHNPPMYYLTGTPSLTHADLVKKRGEEPVLFYNPMERDHAAATGLPIRNLAEYNLQELLKEHGGDLPKATIARYRKMFEDLGIQEGRVAVYGNSEVGRAYAIFRGLEEALPGLEIVGEVGPSILLRAMQTKDEAEVERIRRMGQITVDVVGRVADYLTSHPVEDEVLMKEDGSPLTIGDVKKCINLWLAESGAENPHDTIFAIGRDAGVPHSNGTPTDPIRLGKTIVLDIFPTEAGGGYHYDFTRTWCLGYAPPEAQSLYNDVFFVYQQVMDELDSGSPCELYQDRTCELFEAQGHPTVGSDPKTEEGYVHSLGHGLGLYVHERPVFGVGATEQDRLDPGVVVTIEPGLYYPERGMGVRLEDTVWVRPDGTIEVLADYPLDLVLPMKAG